MQRFNLLKISMLSVALMVATPMSADYVPDTFELPASAPMVFPSQPVLNLSNGGAVEFWVVADWSNNPGYHPVVLSNGNAEAPTYQVSITADRDALIVQSGSFFGQFQFDFSDEQTHHVAILSFDEQLVAMVDGKLIGSVAMSIKPGPAGEFTVGASHGGQTPFIGAISAVRIWDVPLEPEEIAAYALRDVYDTTLPHPNLDNLVAISDFRNGTFSFVETLVVKETDLMSREEIVEVLGEAEVLALEDQFDVDITEEETDD